MAERQNHIFEHLQTLDEEQKINFEEQLNSINIETLNTIFDDTIKNSKKHEKREFYPPKSDSIMNINNNQEYYERGLELLSEGKCGVIILAGGSGSRLGFDLPKGFYVCPGLEENLFQIFFKRLQEIEKLSNNKINLAIMTSDQTDKITKESLKKCGYYGLDETQIHFFKQSSIPSFTIDGKIIIEDKGNISMSPNGNGDIYLSFKSSGIYDKFLKKGIKYVQITNVDNILSKIADPTFFGLIDKENVDLAVKTINKKSDTESVGVFGIINNKLNVIEYSEIGEELAKKKNDNNERLYDCANIGIYVFNLQNLNKYIEQYKISPEYHIARKKITCNLVPEKKIDGIKLELFIFDIFKYIDSYKIIKVNRNQEYSPIKNKFGDDSPESAVRDLLNVQL
jgi:UDP-N-acetylglucosamine/UDP-N-acetylgalactosamine diphosphorylase